VSPSTGQCRSEVQVSAQHKVRRARVSTAQVSVCASCVRHTCVVRVCVTGSSLTAISSGTSRKAPTAEVSRSSTRTDARISQGL
jgi:hypothetical protein